MKLINYILDHCWPWSAIRRLRRELAFNLTVHRDYREWAERFLYCVRTTLPAYKYTELLTQFNLMAEEECAAIGARAHAAQTTVPIFPDPSPLVGDYSHVQRAREAAAAARDRAPEAQAAFDEMEKRWCEYDEKEGTE